MPLPDIVNALVPYAPVQCQMSFLELFDLVRAHRLVLGAVVATVPGLRVLRSLRGQRHVRPLLLREGLAACGTRKRESVRDLYVNVAATHSG